MMPTHSSVALFYTGPQFLVHPSVPIHAGHGKAKMVSPGCFDQYFKAIQELS